jgi:hypothetical protein
MYCKTCEGNRESGMLCQACLRREEVLYPAGARIEVGVQWKYRRLPRLATSVAAIMKGARRWATN